MKTVRIGLDDSKHEELKKIKGSRTWEAVLLMGIEAIKKSKKMKGGEHDSKKRGL